MGRGGGGQDGCERIIKVFVKIKKKTFLGGGGVGSWGGSGWWCQGRCEQRSEVFVKIKKKNGGGGGGSGRGVFSGGGGGGLRWM